MQYIPVGVVSQEPRGVALIMLRRLVPILELSAGERRGRLSRLRHTSAQALTTRGALSVGLLGLEMSSSQRSPYAEKSGTLQMITGPGVA